MDLIVVGLGNKGDKYYFNRHNVGRFFLQKLIKEGPDDFSFATAWQESNKFLAQEIKGDLEDKSIGFFLPQTMMNLSGRSVRKIIDFYGRDKKLLIIHDDLDLPLGQLRFSYNRGPGGHRGIESVNKEINSKSYYRLRIGVLGSEYGIKMNKQITRNFVLSDFSSEEKKVLESLFVDFVASLKTFIIHGPEKAMNIYNQT